MSGPAGAFAFLIARTTRNRIARQLARVRSPRYALAAIVGVLYFWFFFGRPFAPPTATSAGSSTTVGTVAGIGVAITVLFWWLGPSVTRALAFQPAEVQLLFTAPVSRRALIGYKMVRLQLLLLLNAVIWALLMRRFGVTLTAPLRFATAWGLFSVLSLHRLGAALVQAPPVRGVRRVALALAKALAVATALGLVVGVGPTLLQVGTLGFTEGLRRVGAALAAPPAAYALAPFRWVVAPLYATSRYQWTLGFAVVVGIFALHLVWVLAMNVEFEEVAAAASVEVAKRRAAFKERRAGGATVIRPNKLTRDWLPLAPVGRPAVAIVWKNTIALARAGLLRTAVLLVVILVVMSRLLGSAGGALAIPYATLAVMTVLLGPRAVRNDLRQDLLSLAALKSYPLSGTAVVAAEMVSPTLVLAGFQLAMVVLAYFTLPASARTSLSGVAVAGLMVLTASALLVLNAMSIGIQNGFALLFPAWVRLGTDSGGVEAIGQNLLVTVGSLFALVLALVPPAVVGAVVLFLTRPALGVLAAAPAGAAAVGVLALEIALLVRGLGGVFERTDPTALG